MCQKRRWFRVLRVGISSCRVIGWILWTAGVDVDRNIFAIFEQNPWLRSFRGAVSSLMRWGLHTCA